MNDALMNYALLCISQERARQIEEENFSPSDDDVKYGAENAGQLVLAAASFCLSAAASAKNEMPEHVHASLPIPALWPWDASWWKPRSPRRDLVRAAALIVAEIERLDRAAATPRVVN